MDFFFGGGLVFPPGCPALVGVFGGEIGSHLSLKAEALKPMRCSQLECPCTPLAAGVVLGKLAPLNHMCPGCSSDCPGGRVGKSDVFHPHPIPVSDHCFLS